MRLKWAQPEKSIWFSDWIKQSIILSSPLALSLGPLVSLSISLCSSICISLVFPFASCKFYWPHFCQAESQVRKGNDCRHHSTEKTRKQKARKKGNKSVWGNIKISTNLPKCLRLFCFVQFECKIKMNNCYLIYKEILHSPYDSICDVFAEIFYNLLFSFSFVFLASVKKFHIFDFCWFTLFKKQMQLTSAIFI